MGVPGVLTQLAVVAESTPGVAVALSTNDYVDYDSFSIKPDKNWHERKTHTGDQSALGRVPGRVSGEWSYSSEVKQGSAIAATPEQHVLFNACFGENVVIGGTGIYYRLLGRVSPTSTLAVPTFQMVAKNKNYFMHQANMCIVGKYSFEMNEDNPIMFSCEGEFGEFSGIESTPALSITETIGSTAINLDAVSAEMIVIGQPMKIQFSDGEDKGGAGYDATAINHTTSLLTISPGLAAGVNSGVQVQPFAPAPTYGSEDVIPGINNSVTINGVSYDLIRATVEVETGWILKNKNATSPKATGAGINDKRSVTGELVFYMGAGSASLLGKGFNGESNTLSIVMGQAGTSLEYLTFTIPKAIVEVQSEKEIGDELVEVTVKYKAYKSAAANDELQCLMCGS